MLKSIDVKGGTQGRVYGGNPALVHIEDGKRRLAGEAVARFIGEQMRQAAFLRGANSTGALCPGCYMVALVNASVELAQANGQSLCELGRTMSEAFAEIADNACAGREVVTEEICVLLDPD